MRPTLYIFTTSRFCEKARWTLDYLEIEYDVEYLAPGLHMAAAKKMGAAGSTLPILPVDGQVIQGSAEIICLLILSAERTLLWPAFYRAWRARRSTRNMC